jgi:beta-galactosidase
MSETRKVESVTAQGDAITVRFALGEGKASFAVTYRMGADGALSARRFQPIDKTLPAPTRVRVSLPCPRRWTRWRGSAGPA